MTDQALERTSRRAIIGAGLGAAAAATVAALGAPGRAHAVSTAMMTEVNNVAATDTLITATSGTGLVGQAQAVTGIGLHGVAVNQAGGTGVRGYSMAGLGVSGESTTGDAVYGSSSGGVGVKGISQTWYGVYGSSTEGGGVIGLSDTNHGVEASGGGTASALKADNLNVGGTAIEAIAALAGTAIKATGKVDYNRAGRATILAGASSITVAVPGGLTASSLPFANLITNRAGRYVRAVVPNVGAGTITIRLNAAVGAATRVAWFVLR